jgi:hypothetical protein
MEKGDLIIIAPRIDPLVKEGIKSTRIPFSNKGSSSVKVIIARRLMKLITTSFNKRKLYNRVK